MNGTGPYCCYCNRGGACLAIDMAYISRPKSYIFVRLSAPHAFLGQLPAEGRLRPAGQPAPPERVWAALPPYGRLRRPALRALAESFSLRAVDLARLKQAAPAFDTVVNTIPAPVLTEAVLAALRPGSLIVDLASKPGGTDFAAARRLGHRAIHALSLPTACAPETAGEALARTVCEILAEREGTP